MSGTHINSQLRFTTALSAMNRIPGNIVHTFAPYCKILFAYLQKKEPGYLKHKYFVAFMLTSRFSAHTQT